ncbi:MAG: 50S ribosomal protein L25 [Planctomycetes bacterium]|jgi:large subunit ribosomal protein L25|nr:50S ribosomal protein L25 [Planctomycetota bacterium]
MVKKIKLTVEARQEKDGQAKIIRRAGFIPGVLYGSGRENLSLKVKRANLEKAYELAGEATLLDLAIDGRETVPAVFKEVQRDPLKRSIIHADFYQVNMKNKLEVEVPLHFIGEAKAVKELGATLVKNMENIEIRCLPGDLIDKIEVDISGLATFNDQIKISELKVPSSIEIINHPDDVVALVMAPAAEEAPAPAAAEAESLTAAPGEQKGEEAAPEKK